MDYYRIVSPPNAAELDAMLREQPLIGAKLRLKLREDFEGDELAARRGDEPEEFEADFSAEVITTNDPLQVLGQVAIKEVIRTGRIQRRLSSSSIKELLFEEGSLPQFDGDDTLDLDQLELVID